MRSDCASIPTRGSRFVGLLSIIITNVFGSGACEQESSGRDRPPTSIPKIVILSAARDLLFVCSRILSSRIGDLSEDRCALGSRGRWHVTWPSMPRLVRKHGKCNCLLRLRRESELIRRMQADSERCDFVMQHGHQSWVLRASAGDNHLMIMSSLVFRWSQGCESREHKSLHRICD